MCMNKIGAVNKIETVNKIGAATMGSERVNKIVPGEQNRSKYEQNTAMNKIVPVNEIEAVQSSNLSFYSSMLSTPARNSPNKPCFKFVAALPSLVATVVSLPTIYWQLVYSGYAILQHQTTQDWLTACHSLC